MYALTYSQELERRVVLGVGELFSVASNSHVRPSCLIYITTKMTKVTRRIRHWNMLVLIQLVYMYEIQRA